MVRQPAVAGQFYPGAPEELNAELVKMTPLVSPAKRVIGIIAPHAGYMYSGAVAGSIYGSVAVPPTVVILGPNHGGVGARVALSPDGSWLTPLGIVPVNQSLAGLIKKHAPVVSEDGAAHLYEHSLEVQVPFLQYRCRDVTIVPLCLGFGDVATCRALSQGIGAAILEYNADVLIVASSDMTHYESADTARRKDQQAIEQVLGLNPEGLLDVCRKRDISMCGVIPSVVMLMAALALGATSASLVRYGTSGDVTGDHRQVVAYAAIEVL